ncbi:unnamed protein product [Phaedon cochleariae]|uniref:Uracil-DNA glycosylase-like domain-containing protein n=1 Tax=Phaedon cochleariae TaxID=80249 RepID=A0A9P0DPL2_PHACE|nr:unnamed protein product [Phaedon cochleariae]
MGEQVQLFESFVQKYPRLIAPNSISEDWKQFMTEIFHHGEANVQTLHEFIQETPEIRTLPRKEDIWAFTNFCPAPEKTKVIIIGQDPYSRDDVGYGLGFSVKKSSPITPSLENILKEVQCDISDSIYANNLRGFTDGGPRHGCLDYWAKQGVVFLDTALTVEIGKPTSHIGKGWEPIIASIIEKLQICVERDGGKLVLILWGSEARNNFRDCISENHMVLEGGHPSPLNEYDNFLGRRYFSEANDFLVEAGREPIDWSLDEDEDEARN